MSARIIFNRVITARDSADDNQLTVSYQLLLVLYTIIPLCLLLQLFDEWFWQGFLQQHLPSSPKQFLLFQIIFGTPHIIASSLLLACNPEYLRHYKSKLILMTLAIITIFGVGSLLIPYKVLYVMAAVWTVYHVLKQQLGVGRGLYRIPDWFFFLLLWLSVTAGILVYIGIFLQNSLDQQHLAWIKLVAGILCAGLVCSAFYGQHYINTSAGKWFLWANVFLVASSYYLFTKQYFFLAILVPRLVHDATAFIFYVVHDYNKHSKAPQNFMYRQAERCHLPVIVVLPLYSFILAYGLQSYGDGIINIVTEYLFGTGIRKAVTLGLLGYLSLMHYYTEAFMWKHGSPLRRFIAFSK